MYRTIAVQPERFAAYYLPMSESAIRSNRLLRFAGSVLKRLLLSLF